MGQAKNRGSQQARMEMAIQAKSQLRPEYLVCNECQSHITDFHELNTKGLSGINAAYAGICSCGGTTYAISGSKDAVEKAAMALQEQFDFNMKVGVQETGKLINNQ